MILGRLGVTEASYGYGEQHENGARYEVINGKEGKQAHNKKQNSACKKGTGTLFGNDTPKCAFDALARKLG